MKTNDYYDQREDILAEQLLKILGGIDPVYTVEFYWNPPGKILFASTPASKESTFQKFLQKI